MDENPATARGRRSRARRAAAVPAALILLSACSDGNHSTITTIATASPLSSTPAGSTDPSGGNQGNATPPKGRVLIAAPESGGVRHLLTVSADGKVSMSGTRADETTRLVLQTVGTFDTGQYVIMSPLHSEERDAYCLDNQRGTGSGDNPEGSFALAVCDKESLSQVFSFNPSYEGDGFVIAAPYGTIMAAGTRAYSVVSEEPTHFTVTSAS
jgi:hypothetical protein